MKKAYLFVDGSNLYAGQFELFGPLKCLVFSQFIREVENKIGIHFDQIYFYASYSPQPKRPTEKEKLFLKNAALFYKSVKETEKAIFFLGYRSKTSGKEKEVDVKLAVDVVDLAHKNKYKVLYLLSGDADFMQALHVVKDKNIQINVLCLENKIMYKAMLFYRVFVLNFTGRIIQLKKIRNRPRNIVLEKNRLVSKI